MIQLCMHVSCKFHSLVVRVKEVWGAKLSSSAEQHSSMSQAPKFCNCEVTAV